MIIQDKLQEFIK